MPQQMPTAKLTPSWSPGARSMTPSSSARPIASPSGRSHQNHLTSPPSPNPFAKTPPKLLPTTAFPFSKLPAPTTNPLSRLQSNPRQKPTLSRVGRRSPLRHLSSKRNPNYPRNSPSAPRVPRPRSSTRKSLWNLSTLTGRKTTKPMVGVLTQTCHGQTCKL